MNAVSALVGIALTTTATAMSAKLMVSDIAGRQQVDVATQGRLAFKVAENALDIGAIPPTQYNSCQLTTGDYDPMTFSRQVDVACDKGGDYFDPQWTDSRLIPCVPCAGTEPPEEEEGGAA